MSDTQYKLTMVSVKWKGTQVTRFTMAPVYNGKAVVPQSYIDSLLASIGCTANGLTYTLG